LVVERLGSATELPLREQIAQALVNKGLTQNQLERHEDALKVYDQVVERFGEATEAVLREQVAQALVCKGATLGQLERHEDALKVYDQMMTGFGDACAPELRELVAQALANRGWIRYEKNEFESFLRDTEAALGRQPSLDIAAFNLGLALLANDRDEEAVGAYRYAGEQFPDEIDHSGLSDLEEAKRKWLTAERAQPIIELLQSLKKQTLRGMLIAGMSCSAGDSHVGRGDSLDGRQRVSQTRESGRQEGGQADRFRG
jgi:tetratricopeptide (TPR) repeat protein